MTVSNAPKVPKHILILRHVVSYSQFIIFIMLGIAFFAAGPKLETILYPPISVFKIEEIEKLPGGKARISGVMKKERPECVRQSIIINAEYLDQSQSSKSIEVRGAWGNMGGGSQYWGPWLLHAPGPPLGPTIVISAVYQCHGFWNTEIVLYQGATRDFFDENRIRGDEPWDSNSEANH